MAYFTCRGTSQGRAVEMIFGKLLFQVLFILPFLQFAQASKRPYQNTTPEIKCIIEIYGFSKDPLARPPVPTVYGGVWFSAARPEFVEQKAAGFTNRQEAISLYQMMEKVFTCESGFDERLAAIQQIDARVLELSEAERLAFIIKKKWSSFTTDMTFPSSPLLAVHGYFAALKKDPQRCMEENKLPVATCDDLVFLDMPREVWMHILLFVFEDKGLSALVRPVCKIFADLFSLRAMLNYHNPQVSTALIKKTHLFKVSGGQFENALLNGAGTWKQLMLDERIDELMRHLEARQMSLSDRIRIFYFDRLKAGGMIRDSIFKKVIFAQASRAEFMECLKGFWESESNKKVAWTKYRKICFSYYEFIGKSKSLSWPPIPNTSAGNWEQFFLAHSELSE